MAKTYNWEVKETVTVGGDLDLEGISEELRRLEEASVENNSAKAETREITHKVSLTYSNLTGKAVITIDSDRFDISSKPLSLKGTSQMFRLGEMAAIIDFPKKGEPDIVIDGVCVRSGKPYNG